MFTKANRCDIHFNRSRGTMKSIFMKEHCLLPQNKSPSSKTAGDNGGVVASGYPFVVNKKQGFVLSRVSPDVSLWAEVAGSRS